MFFEYGKKEVNYLKSKDKKLSAVIEKIGYIERKIEPDLFSAIIYNIIGQQISSKAQATICKRLFDSLGFLTPEKIFSSDKETLQSFGISSRKTEYIKNFAEKIVSGEFDLNAVKKMSDGDAISTLTSLKGVGVWTAEMTLLFCLQRKNIFSFKDFGIRRGLCKLYCCEEITSEFFERCRKKFSPYCSVASLYLWEIAGGNFEDDA